MKKDRKAAKEDVNRVHGMLKSRTSVTRELLRDRAKEKARENSDT